MKPPVPTQVALVTQIALAGRVGSLAYVAALVAFHYFDETTDAMVIWSWMVQVRGGERRYLVFVVLGRAANGCRRVSHVREA